VTFHSEAADVADAFFESLNEHRDVFAESGTDVFPDLDMFTTISIAVSAPPYSPPPKPSTRMTCWGRADEAGQND